MSAFGKLTAAVLVAGTAGWVGLTAGEKGITVADLMGMAEIKLAVLMGNDAVAMPGADTPQAEPSGPVIYWRHPDGLPEWSASEQQSADGRAFLPVLESEDLLLGPAPELPVETAMVETGERTILYYRNPMGLPDTSPVPKQDSMGMDYIAVYEGGDSDDGSVTVSPGKLQRTGVRTSEAVLAPLAASLRAPGIVMLDERKISVLSLRADAFIETVVITHPREGNGTTFVDIV